MNRLRDRKFKSMTTHNDWILMEYNTLHERLIRKRSDIPDGARRVSLVQQFPLIERECLAIDFACGLLQLQT